MVKEKIVWRGQPSQKGNITSFIAALLFCWLWFPPVLAFVRYLATKYTSYELTSERLRYTHGIVNRRNDELELYRVKDVSLFEPLYLRIFGLAMIEIASSDRTHKNIKIEAIDLEKATKLREYIRKRTEELRRQKGVREIDLG